MDQKIYFFGYGANKNRQRIAKILGKDPEGGYGAIAEGFSLNIQSLDQIPEPVRETVIKVFGNNFRSYTIKPDPTSIVIGVVWELNQQDLETIKKWESIGTWREIIQIKVKTAESRVINVITEKIFDSQQLTKKVDGLYYLENLNWKPPKMEEDKIEKEYRIEELKKELELVKTSTQA